MQTELANKKNEKSTEKRKENKEKIENNTRISFSLHKLKLIKTIRTIPYYVKIYSICLLKDKRLVSTGSNHLIVVYNYSYLPQIQIKHDHDGGIVSLCLLKNGDLASASEDKTIKIWRIGENDYQFIHTLKGHTNWLNKVIGLEDGRISSCSYDKTIKIWDNNTYQCIATIKLHTHDITSIIEMNDSIISVSYNNILRWNKSSYECIQVIQNAFCSCSNGLEKLNNHTLLLGGNCVLFVVDIESSEVKEMQDSRLGYIKCFRVIRNDLVLSGNDKGEICCYNPSSNQIISKSKFHNDEITCLIESEDNKIISSSYDTTIHIYESVYDDSALPAEKSCKIL